MTAAGTFQYKTKPYDHQVTALRLSARRKVFGLFMDPGTGKTKVILDNAAYLFQQGEIDTLVVLAPNGVHRQWIEEVEKHLPDWCLRAAAFSNKLRKDYGFSSVRQAAGKTLRVFTINMEAISREKGAKFVLELLKAFPRNMLVIDESQRIKTPRSGRTRAAWKLAKVAKYRRIASGSPVGQGIHDLYAQMRFLDPAIIGCKTFTEFRNNYCIMRGGLFPQIIGYRNQDELMRKIAPHIYSVRMRDCLDIPMESYTEQVVALSDEQRRMYNELRKHLITEAKGITIEGDRAVTRLLRLQQILAGHITDKENDAWKPIDCPRIQQAVDIAEQTPGKCIIWTRFTPDIVQLVAELIARSIPYVEYSGRFGDDICAANLARFKTDPEYKVLLGNTRKGGVGLTIIEADAAIFYSNSHSYIDRYQAVFRNVRAGQTKHCVFYDLIAKGTIDEKVLKVLEAKGTVADMMKDPKNYLKWLETEPEL